MKLVKSNTNSKFMQGNSKQTDRRKIKLLPVLLGLHTPPKSMRRHGCSVTIEKALVHAN